MTTETRTNRTLQNRTLLGVLLMILALGLYPLSDAFVKHLMGTYTVPQITFLRAITRLLPLFVATFFQGGPLTVLGTRHPSRHLFRLGVNLAYTYAFMYAFSKGSLTIVYTLSYTSPLFMILLSAVMLKENVSRERWVAVGVGLVGVMIAMVGIGLNPRPGANVTFELAALAVAGLVLGGTFLGALNKILMRRLASTEHSLAIAIYPNLVMIAVTVPFLVATWQAMPWEHWGLFAIVGLITAGAQYAIAQALRFTQASILAPIDYSSFFWVAALDFFWWQKSIDAYTLAAAIVIVGSNLYILYRARREEKLKKEALAPAG
jgi:drug/metabolite transporter (DMT)-like permease